VQQGEPVGEAVLEVGELLEEHHRADRAVAVDQRHPAVRLDLEHRPDDREHRGDAAAGSDCAVVPGLRRVEVRGEPTGRRHHLDDVADLQGRGRVGRERAAGQPLDPDPQPAARRGRADRVVAPHLLAFDLGAQGQVLAGFVDVVVGQLFGNLEGDGDGVVGQRLDGVDPQRMKRPMPPTGVDDRRRRLGVGRHDSPGARRCISAP
jgi:hypothetical protein